MLPSGRSAPLHSHAVFSRVFVLLVSAERRLPGMLRVHFSAVRLLQHAVLPLLDKGFVRRIRKQRGPRNGAAPGFHAVPRGRGTFLSVG